MASYGLLFGLIAALNALAVLGLLIWVLIAGRGRARVFGGAGLGLMLLTFGVGRLLSLITASIGMEAVIMVNALTTLLGAIALGLLAAGVVVGSQETRSQDASTWSGQEHNQPSHQQQPPQDWRPPNGPGQTGGPW